MELDYNIISIIDILGCLQGIILGGILLYSSFAKKRERYFLGLFVFVYAYSFIPIIVEDLNLVTIYPWLSVMPRPGEWLLTSIFLIYIQKISILSNKEISYWYLYPGIFIALVQLVIFVLPVSTKVAISNTIWYKIIFLLGLIYSSGILVYTWRFIGRHSREVENQYSLVAQKQLSWAKRFVLFGFALFALHFVRFFIGENMGYRIIYASANVFMLYWASIHGIMQPKIISLVESETTKDGFHATKERAIDIFSEKERRKLIAEIDNYMLESNTFTQKELTIVNVASKLKTHPRRVSVAINAIRGQNFNAYINQFRVEKARELLNDIDYENLSIEGIGYEVGFQSKSAFYNAFKRVTGTTPHRYKERFVS